MNTFDLIVSDLYRYTNNVGFKDFLINMLTNRGFIFMFWFRLSQSKNAIIRNFAYPICFLKNRKFHIHMNPKSVKIGCGFYIGHGGPIIIHPKVVFGDNCNISQFVTVGSVTDSAAIIGDDVWIGPNSVISGPVKIGDGAVIGAGSVVMHDVLPNTTVAGFLARQISENCSEKLIARKYPRRRH